MRNLAGTSKNAPISLFVQDGQGKSCGSYELSSWNAIFGWLVAGLWVVWLVCGWFVGGLTGFWVVCRWFVGDLWVVWLVCGLFRNLQLTSCNISLFCIESKKKGFQEYLSFCWACMFWYVIFYKNLIVALHHGGNAFPFYFYICIKLTHVNNEEMLIYQLMWCVNYIIKNLFHYENNIALS